MNKRRLSIAAASLASLVLGATATLPASGAAATATQPSAACRLALGSVDSVGGHTGQEITAGTPPTASAKHVTPIRFAPGVAKLSGSWISEPNIAGSDNYGKLVLGTSLYAGFYQTNELDKPTTLRKIGGGWDQFSFYEESRFDQSGRPGGTWHTYEYALRKDGVLARWRIGDKGQWIAAGTYAGFSSVKTMALISQTPSYDTFLANARGGALYTIRIPLSSPLKPVVTKVRSSTWQGFETLIAERCGQHGTLLLGIDKETKTGFLYAVGRASGTATVINGLGKVPATFADPVYFRNTVVAFASDPLNGD
ncbi:hypothetical protein AB0P21_08195 [Kribbella sp. NPDC056861]|uniref:hypothetical protein n=1 Tax=Kribbella sp. NPDC056861 TaxID=3154857 RepID=UPI00343C77BB